MEANNIQKEFGVDVNSPVYNQRLQELDATLVEIVSLSEEVTNSLVRRMEEVYFQHVFLPILIGDVTECHGATISTWINYAGGQYNAVDITDQRGNILFRVPALYDRDTIKPNIERDANIADIMNMAKKHHEISPVRGNNYRQNGLFSVLNEMYNPEMFVKNIDVWNAIFKRYGRDLKQTVKNNTTDISNDTNQQPIEDEFDYE